MKNYWADHGGLFGLCHSHEDSPWFWVNIPKNASSFTQTLFAHQLLWYEHNFHDQPLDHKTPIVVLRDPINRWISGIAEYATLYHKQFNKSYFNEYFLDWIFDRVAFDDHTEKQIYYVDGLDLNKCVWFWVDQTYETKLINWMESKKLVQTPFHVPKCVYEFSNKSTEKPDKIEISKYFRDIISSNTKYFDKLKTYFKPDYDLINQVSFV